MENDPVEVLIFFMKEMNQWENSYRDAFMKDHGIKKEPYLIELNDIFSKWCTVKERKHGRQTSMQVSFPPDYDPVTDKIVNHDIIKNKAFITVQKETGFKNRYLYTLNLKNKEWRIDKKERFSSEENKWVRDNL